MPMTKRKFTVEEVDNGYIINYSLPTPRTKIYTTFEGVVNELAFHFEKIKAGQKLTLIKEKGNRHEKPGQKQTDSKGGTTK